jgi:hypothetical protein
MLIKTLDGKTVLITVPSANEMTTSVDFPAGVVILSSSPVVSLCLIKNSMFVRGNSMVAPPFKGALLWGDTSERRGFFKEEVMTQLANMELAKCKAILGMQIDVDRFGQTWDRANANAKEILARSADLDLEVTLLPWVDVPYAKKLVLKGAAKRFKADFSEIIRSITP